MKRSCAVYAGMWLVWSAWTLFLLPRIALGQTELALLDSVAAKAAVWVLPLALLGRLRRRELFGRPFPWLPCLVLLCGVTAFLHTLRLLNGLQNTHVIFDPMFILFSLTAGIWEELSFRGGLFAWQEKTLAF